MTVEASVQRINELINNKFSINIMQMGFSDKHFFGNDIDLHARDLVYVLYQIERMFSITMSEEDILSHYFYTLNGLGELVSGKIYEATIAPCDIYR